MDGSVTVSIVSSNGLTRQGLARLLEAQDICVCDVAESVDALQKAGATVLVDLTPEIDPGQAIRSLRERFQGASVAALGDKTTHSASELVAMGADQFVSRSIDPDALGLMVRLLAKHMTLADLAEHVFDAQSPDDSKVYHVLSSREVTILQKLVEGMSDDGIAEALGIVNGTVKVHVKSILRKLNAKNRTQAAIWAYQNGVRPSGLVS